MLLAATVWLSNENQTTARHGKKKEARWGSLNLEIQIVVGDALGATFQRSSASKQKKISRKEERWVVAVELPRLERRR
jgi:hypothetical protein